MKMQTYVNFAGKCAEAFRFYEKHLGGKISMMMTHGQAPDRSKLNPEWKDAVLHARVSIGGTELMGADIPNAEPMRSAYLSLGVESDTEAERIFSELSDAGEVFMPMQETFFATRFGQLRDRFGINWMLAHERVLSGNSAEVNYRPDDLLPVDSADGRHHSLADPAGGAGWLDESPAAGSD